MTDAGYQCPFFKPKELARIPLAFWFLLTMFLTMYTTGRMVTVFGKRLCE